MSGPHWAIDGEGHPLPHNSADVEAITRRSLAEGDLMVAILKMPNGDLVAHIIGDPSQEVADCLQATATAYAAGIRGH
jgi:hypothetical protein